MTKDQANGSHETNIGFEAAKQIINGAKVVGIDGVKLDPDDVFFDVHAMNEHYALVMMGGKPLILEENFKRGDCPVEDRVNLISVDAFHAWFANQEQYVASDKKVSWSRLWFRDPERRQYRGVSFAPGTSTHSGIYNLWRGFSLRADYEECEKKCDIFLDHVRTNIAGGNEEHFRFIMGWAAHMLQKPTERAGVAIVLRGGQGSGKTLFGQTLGRLIEDHYALVDDPRYVVGNFNAHLASTLLLQADEGFWAGDKHAEGRLKGLVTSDYHMIERKGVDAFRVKNYVHLLVTSNNDWVVPAGHDERRFAVFDVSNNSQQNRNYFGEMIKQLDDGGYEALLGYLLSFDVDSINLWDIPKTAALADQKLSSLSVEESWWLVCLRRGHVTFQSDGAQHWMPYLPKADVYANYLQWVTQRGRRFPLTEEQFGRRLMRVCSGVSAGRRRFDQGVRKYVYQFPPLEECRRLFAEMIRTDIDWYEREFDDAHAGSGDFSPDDF
ncbi:primase-helicase family protein [Thalassospira sp.]|uniref:primase-helicase family protein n=1 Tax=Thalassospira sp. TaxID=1912094 RepID=UPI003AA7B715